MARDTFFSLLETRVGTVGSLLCVGLDPHLSLLAEPSASAARAFCLDIIRQTAPYAAAFKPNAAFFEVFGPSGWEALAEVIAAARRTGALVILDAKRGDIASTAEAYARSAFDRLGAQAVTLNPYLGYDAVAPFIGDPAKGAFLLCKTSNPGSADLQDVEVGGWTAGSGRWTVDGGRWTGSRGGPVLLYEYVARLAQGWNTRGNIGLVVGATQPEALRRVRAAAPDLWFLSPGVGAQGGDLAAALRAGLRPDGMGMLINVSRGIARSENPRQAAISLRDAILQVVG